MDAAGLHHTALVRIIREIKPGIASDRIEACLDGLRLPKRLGDQPRPKELEHLAIVLEREITPATWLSIAMMANQRGYYLPSSLDTMIGIVMAAPAGRKQPDDARRARWLALACACLYFDLTREPPPVRNPRGHRGGTLNRYLALVEAAFARAELPKWRSPALEAAREMYPILGKYGRRGKK